MTPPLHIVTDADAEPPPAKTETVSERIKRLQAEARQLARDHVRSLLAGMEALEAVASEIAAGGGAYHDGAQERARRIAMELASQRATLEQIVGRSE